MMTIRRLPRLLQLPMALGIVIAFTSAWIPWASLALAATPRWDNTGALVTSRGLHTATLLADDNVLIAGGYGGSYVLSAEVYNPGTGAFTSTGEMMICPHVPHGDAAGR